MTRIAFFEPLYSPGNLRDWEIRGSYKYPSLLAGLRDEAEILILMSSLPPQDDTHRQALERDIGARFAQIDTLDDPGDYAADDLFADYCAAIETHSPDIVSTLNGRMIGFNFALARAAQAQGVDYVYRVAGNDIATRIAVLEARGRPVERTSLWAGLMAQERFALEAARTIITMGATEKLRVANFVSDPAKITICRRGVDRAHFSPSPDTAAQCDRFLFLGRNSAEKGIDLIEEAAARLARERPAVRITIAGDSEERDEGNRRYLGFHDYDALPELYRDHDALILPARSEGFPQVVMEAMSCGLPAILSEHLFTHDFANGEGAMLIRLDGGELAARMIALHDDPALFATVRQAALNTAEREFDAYINSPHYRAALLGQAG